MGDLTFSLVWNDESDLDLWVTMPSGELVWYRASNPNPTPNPSPSSNRNPNPNPNPNPSPHQVWYQSKKSSCGAAELDIDMNANYVKSKEPVENVYVGDAEVDGRYREI